MATSHCIEPLFDCNISREEVDEICRRHKILPQHRQCYWRMVARGEIYPVRFRHAHLFTAAITNGRRARFWQSWTP